MTDDGGGILRYGHTAMACRFEIICHGRDRDFLRCAAEEAFEAVDAVEEELSIYRPSSEISRINALASYESVRLSLPIFLLLVEGLAIADMTGGAFDITAGPLIRLWTIGEGGGARPGQEEIERARKVSGCRHVILNVEEHSVRFDVEGVEINLGAFGKGFAVDRAAEVLTGCGIESALVHAGTSTVRAIGAGPEGDGWRVGVRHPRQRDSRWSEVTLDDESLSTSGDYEQFFECDGQRYGHVLDPRTGLPATGAISATVVTTSAALSDALSTAAMVLGPREFDRIDFGGLSIRSFFITQGDLDEGHRDHPA